MARARRIAALAAVTVACLAAHPAAALELLPSIDLDYTYKQEHLGEGVTASTAYKQVYEIKYDTSLTTALDFLTTVRLELQDQWYSDDANTSRVSPTLELAAKGDKLAVKAAYSGSVTTTDEFREDARREEYSNSADLDVEVTPDFWPEVKFKFQDKRDYEEQREDATSRLTELQLRDEVFGVVLEYQLQLTEDVDVLPARARSEGTDWSFKSTFHEELFDGTDFEISHQIKETYTEDSKRGVFTSLDEDYTQSLKARLKSSLVLTSRLNLQLAWEYEFAQDLLQLEYDWEVRNRYSAELRYDMFRALKFSVAGKRETALTEPMVGEDSESEVNDTVRAAFDFAPVPWLRLGGKAEFETKDKITADSGATVDTTDEQLYELALRNKFGDLWEATVNGSYREAWENGHVETEEAKLKAAFKVSFFGFSVQPQYEGQRAASWDDVGDPSEQSSAREIKIRFDYKVQLFDLLQATFAHEYGTKLTLEYDEVENLERELTMNEDTTLNLTLADLVEGLRLEGELQRKGSDTEDDEDPELVELSYTLKLEWTVEELSLGGSVQYNDKGDDYDDVNVTTRLSWKGESFGVSGEYQLAKTYSEETDEERTLNLKLFYKF